MIMTILSRLWTNSSFAFFSGKLLLDRTEQARM
jgi:hypothetical protein